MNVSFPYIARYLAALLAIGLFAPLIWLVFGNASTADSAVDRGRPPSDALIARGGDLVHLGGCDHCHTPRFAELEGKVADSQRLIGSDLGWQGPWGTTYPANLRQLARRVTADEWLKVARRATRPPMPWYTLRDLGDEDLLAMYAFIRSLGPSDAAVPSYVPPGQPAQTPVVKFPGAPDAG